MTPRKEIFIKVKETLEQNVSALEMVDLQRNQFDNEEKNYPSYFTCALVKIKNISWENMTEGKQEGKCTIDISLYCKDGWMDQHSNTNDPSDGLDEIDLIDQVVEALEDLYSECFRPLELSSEEAENENNEIFIYTISFDTTIYRKMKPKYTIKNFV